MIIVNQIPVIDYKRIALKAVHYAIISTPFTINRMGIGSLEKRITNITKGKLAEGLFRWWALQEKLPIDFSSGSTPFYQVDKFDFAFKGKNWDLKNNFLFHKAELLQEDDYLRLPALVPNRHSKDQWSKRNEKNFLFTFMKLADRPAGQKRQAFLHLDVSNEQILFLKKLVTQYQGKTQNEPPYTPEWFWKEWDYLGPLRNIGLTARPALIIAAYANESCYKSFHDTEARTFLKGTLKTRIRNATCAIGKLKKFESLI